MTTPRDDSLMNRFDEHGLRRFRARDAVFAVLLTSLLLVLAAGSSIRDAGDRMDPGIGRTLVRAAGEPAGWLADRLPVADAVSSATAWLSPDDALDPGTGFAARSAGADSAGIPPVGPDAFRPEDLGGPPPRPRPLRTLLVTGDSMSTPLDTHLARALAGRHVRVIRDPHLGTGISKTFVVDWGKLSARHVKTERPDAVVVFIGANEGFPMPSAGGADVDCCGADWAALYANRVRTVMQTYRQGGAARVYWITLPTPRDHARARVSRVVNAAVAAAAQAWRAQIRVVDTVPIFTPSGYRAAMQVDGSETIVRQPDGIHLNDVGAGLLAEDVLDALRVDFSY
jgi:lysophospholipase L1-like esterase